MRMSHNSEWDNHHKSRITLLPPPQKRDNNSNRVDEFKLVTHEISDLSPRKQRFENMDVCKYGAVRTMYGSQIMNRCCCDGY